MALESRSSIPAVLESSPPVASGPDPATARRLDSYFQELGNPSLEDGRPLQEMVWSLIEHERRRIGQDIHDGLCQQITGISFMVKALQEKLTAKHQPECAEAALINRLLQDAIAQARDLARGLFPAELDTGGLVPALEKLIASMESLFPVSCRLECPEARPPLPSEPALHLFRIAQEALTNAVKHGQARSIVIRLECEASRVTLSILDDGIGMAPSAADGSGLGLRIMRNRARAIGAQLQIDRPDAGGTCIRCVWAEGTVS